MKLLLELRDEDIGAVSKKSIMKERSASRAILMNNGKIALMNVTKHNYHKLPGGGIEKGESIEDALFREMKEETGCKIKIIGEVGKIIEHRTRFNILQTSYCFLAEVLEKGEPEFDKGELAAGYKVEWTTMNQALKLLKKEKQETYDGKFIVIRDSKFIEEARKIMNSAK
ncbi:MAG: NUDIX domain-containing protein [Candidatus Aenigmatarchaeota archaeon]